MVTQKDDGKVNKVGTKPQEEEEEEEEEEEGQGLPWSLVLFSPWRPAPGTPSFPVGVQRSSSERWEQNEQVQTRCPGLTIWGSTLQMT